MITERHETVILNLVCKYKPKDGILDALSIHKKTNRIDLEKVLDQMKERFSLKCAHESVVRTFDVISKALDMGTLLDKMCKDISWRSRSLSAKSAC